MAKNVFLTYTKVFSILDVRQDESGFPHAYCVSSLSSHIDQFVSNMNSYGLCVCRDSVPDRAMKNARDAIYPFVEFLIQHYDILDDEFVNVDREAMNIVRMPRIGRGKHNIHFDPQLSQQHKVLVELAHAASFSDALSMYMNAPFSIRESGISITRPHIAGGKFCPADVDGGSSIDSVICSKEGKSTNILDITTGSSGDGMEWHSDGPCGEATILMSLGDVSQSMGSLRVVPGSHKEYIDGIGHDEELLKIKADSLEARKIIYNYRAAQPMIIDARTLHSVSPNLSAEWRIVVWYIFDSF